MRLDIDERTVTGTTEGWTHKLRQLAEALTAANAYVVDKGDDDE
jgi:hypothetical protein